MTRELKPLISNNELERLLSRAKGMSRANRDTVYEALVYIRGTYERDRAQRSAETQTLADKLARLCDAIDAAGLWSQIEGFGDEEGEASR